MHLTEYKAEDLLELRIRECDSELRGMDIAYLAHQFEHSVGFFRTLRETPGGRPLAVGGVSYLTPRRGEAWLICDETIPRFVRQLWDVMKYTISEGVQQLNIRRLEANVHEAHELSLRMTPRLGFSLEGIRPLYFPDGGACYHFTRFFED